MQAEQPFVAGPSRAGAQKPQVSGSEAETDAASEVLEEDEDPGLAPRAWTVVGVCGRRDHILRGVDEYQIRWARTRHATAEFRISTRRGRLRVKVGHERWRIVSYAEARSDERAREPETVVQWANTWHTIWELSSAFAAIVEFEVQNPRLDRQLTMKLKPDLRDWALFLWRWHDPEEEPAVDHGDDRIEGDGFGLEEGVDYTSSLLGYFARLLRSGGKLPSPVITRLLCMPVRQRVVFRPEYVRENLALSGGTKMWRALSVYVVGLAHRQPCSRCLAGGDDLAFPKCVSWGGIFAEACVNCAIAGSKHLPTCECRIGPWSWKNNARENQQPERRFHAEAAQTTSSPHEQRRSVGLQSSVELSSDDGYTPPSERSSPSHGGERGNAGQRRSVNQSSARRGGPSPSHVFPDLGDRAPAIDVSETDPGVGDADSRMSREGSGPHSRSTAQDQRSTGGRVLRSTRGRFGAWSTHSSSEGYTSRDNNATSGKDTSFDTGSGVDDHSSPSIDTRVASALGPRAGRNRPLSSRQLGKRPVASHRRTDADHAGDSELKRRRLEGAARPTRAFKCEPTSSAAARNPALELAGIDISRHTSCSRHPQDPCVDPVVGAAPSRPYDRFDPPPGVVYAHDHHWDEGSLDDDNVEFIMSCCPCAVTEYLDDAWKRLVEANAKNQSLSRYAVLSRVYTNELNTLIQSHCPGQPQWPGEVIEIE